MGSLSYAFGPFRYDPAQLALCRGREQLALPSRALDLLEYFLERPGVVIAKNELLDGVWRDANVGEESLTQAISVVRQVLGDDPQNPTFIQTVPRRGYRFIAEVSTLPAGPFQRHRLRWAAAAFVVASVGASLFVLYDATGGAGEDEASSAALRPLDSVAVLPFRNLSNDPEKQYFADGMTEALIAELGSIDGLRNVISRTSVMQYRDPRRRLPEIAAELVVEGIVEASVLQGDEKVRITAQLYHAQTETPLWGATYERDVTDVLGLVGEVTRAIATGIRVELTPEDVTGLTTPARVDPEAYDAYLRGLFHMARFTAEETIQAVEYFEQAIEQDPAYAPARAGRAAAYFDLGQPLSAMPHMEAMPIAKQEALRALAIDPDSTSAHRVHASVLRVYDWDWDGAEREYRRAIALNPSAPRPHIGYAFLLSSRGQHEQALAEARRAQELAPLDQAIGASLAEIAYAARRFDDAIHEGQRVLEMGQDFRRTYVVLRWTYEALGRYDDALATLRTVAQLDGAPERASQLTAVYASGGAEGYWQWRLDRALAQTNYVAPHVLAERYMRVGQTERALSWLETAFEQRSGLMAHLQYPRWDALRAHDRFIDLQRRVGLEP